jgi:outer membrane protein assembly factor BamB
MPLVVDHPGWPVETTVGVRCSPLMIWDRGTRRLAVTENTGVLHLLTSDGQESPGFPFTAPGGSIWGSVASGDLDGDGVYELVFGSKNDTLYAVHRDGSLLFKRNMGAEIWATPIISDLEEDGSPEIILGTMDSELHVLTALGENKNPFPIILGGPVMTDAALADLNEDGNLDVMVGVQSGDFYAINTQNGQTLEGFPVSTGGAIWSGPVVADITKDGHLEVAFGSDDKKLYVVDRNGTVLLSKSTGNPIRSSPAIGDIDGDGSLDVVFTSQDHKVYAMNRSGLMINGWPYDTGVILWSSPIIVDIDDDEEMEVVVEAPGSSLLHLDSDGSLLLDLHFDASGIPQSSPVVGDLDTDGDLEIAGGASDGIYVWDYSTPSTVEIAWPMYRGNERRTGFFEDITTEVVEGDQPEPVVPGRYSLYQNYPNPFNPETTICYSLAQTGRAELIIYNVLGQEVATLVDRHQMAGEHQILWDGTDLSGHPVSSGLYFYRLQAGDFSETKKMVLLR